MFNSIDININLEDSLNTSQEELINIDFPIYIDGNWSETVALYEWASGNGNEEDPWVIEGIHVTNENQTAYISIEKAEHFIIRNVIVSNYAAPYGHYTFAGIYIEKGEYGLIENCTIIHCSVGISFYEAKDNIKITNCNFIGSHNDSKTGMGAAILIQEAKGVEISYNNIYNYYDGIVVRDAEEIYIDNNRIETSFGHISDTGIYFYTVSNSEITNNDFYGCTFAGHEYNDIITSGIDGLKISSGGNFGEDCLNLKIYGNRFYDLNGNLIENNSNNLINVNIVIICVICVCIVCIGILIKRKRNIKSE